MLSTAGSKFCIKNKHKKLVWSFLECGLCFGFDLCITRFKIYRILESAHTKKNQSGLICWYSVGSLVPIEHHLNTIYCLSVVADHVLLLITTVDLFSDYCLQYIAPCRWTQITSNWFLEHDKVHCTWIGFKVTSSQSSITYFAPMRCSKSTKLSC